MNGRNELVLRSGDAYSFQVIQGSTILKLRAKREEIYWQLEFTAEDLRRRFPTITSMGVLNRVLSEVLVTRENGSYSVKESERGLRLVLVYSEQFSSIQIELIMPLAPPNATPLWREEAEKLLRRVESLEGALALMQQRLEQLERGRFPAPSITEEAIPNIDTAHGYVASRVNRYVPGSMQSNEDYFVTAFTTKRLDIIKQLGITQDILNDASAAARGKPEAVRPQWEAFSIWHRLSNEQRNTITALWRRAKPY